MEHYTIVSLFIILIPDIRDGNTIVDLYNQIGVCDGVLEQLDNLLSKFQDDIRNIGAEMKSLQDSCLLQEQKLKNRKASF